MTANLPPAAPPLSHAGTARRQHPPLLVSMRLDTRVRRSAPSLARCCIRLLALVEVAGERRAGIHARRKPPRDRPVGAGHGDWVTPLVALLTTSDRRGLAQRGRNAADGAF
jgi:hypothetical protein